MPICMRLIRRRANCGSFGQTQLFLQKTNIGFFRKTDALEDIIKMEATDAYMHASYT